MTGHRRTLRTLLAVAIAVVLIGDAFAFVRGLGRTNPVTLSEAVREYRVATGGEAPTATTSTTVTTIGRVPVAATAAATAAATGAVRASRTRSVGTAAPALPPPDFIPTPRPGVYSYDTSGTEHVDVLGGQSHTYPAVSYITFAASACGDDVRWTPLQQRWDEYDYCAAGRALLLRRYTAYHNFFGQSDTKVYICPAGAYIRPPVDRVGADYHSHCTGNGLAEDTILHTVGVEILDVGGVAVPALHVRADQIATGAVTGRRVIDAWWSLADNLLVRFVSSADARGSTAFGDTHYQEHVTLGLRSLTPQQ